MLLADDSVIVREGLRALLGMTDDMEVVGLADDYDELIARADALAPQAIVTDIRMPPTFQREGIDAARLVRKRHPGTGIVILSQFDDPEYAVALLSEGASGCAYLLKDGVAAGDQLARAIRIVTSGGSVLDPKIVAALVRPLGEADLSPLEEELLALVAEGRPIKAIAIKRRTTGADVATSIEQLFFKLAKQATGGGDAGLRNLRRLHQAVSARIDDLTAAMVEEYGGVVRFARLIVQSGIDAFPAAEKGLDELPLTRSWGKTTVTLEPVGVAGLITAWNANALFVCLKLASAVGAGCTVVIKPSELNSLQTQVMLECLDATKLPQGVCNVVIGRGNVVGAELVRSPDVAKISFTGSVAVGQSIMRDGAATMKRVTLGANRPPSCSMMPLSTMRFRRLSFWPL